MGGTVHAHGRRGWARLVVLTLAVIGALGVVAPAALAVFEPIDVVCDGGNATMHGDDLMSTDCKACHGVEFPVEPIAPVDTKKCLYCHEGGYENRPVESGFDTCWSCHYPGEKQDDVQSSDGCAAEGICHPVDDASNEPHFGANTKGCVDGCHRTSAHSMPDGSPHHDDGLPGCYDCHDGAQALEKVHEPYVNTRKIIFYDFAANCDTCHVGYTFTHAAPAAIDHTATAPTAKSPVVYGGSTVVSGILYKVLPDGTRLGIISGASVSIVARPVPELDWNTLILGFVPTDLSGKYTFLPVSPTKNTAYATIAQGKVVGDRILKPARGTILVKVAPIVKERLNKTSLTLGGTITVTGWISAPHPITNGKVKWVFQRYIDGVWKTVTTTSAKLLVYNTAGEFAATFTYKPAKKGSWRVRTTFVATPEYTTAVSAYYKFTVK